MTSTGGGPAPSGARPRLAVQMWIDLTCAECYVAKRRFEEAVSAFEHPAEVEVRYRSMEQPAASVSSAAVAAAREEGLPLDVGSLRPTSTFDAHRAVQLARGMGGPALQSAVLERLFRAHFAEGRSLADHEALQRLGAEAGLDERRLAAVLAGEQYVRDVREDEEVAAASGITDLPHVQVNEGEPLSGLRSTEDYRTLLQRAWHDLGR
ncbi:MAG TPA: DsbA family protein [Segeticoccus sp.]|uniref:DsbA family oxidoreductase n=1 Tax=Segeticoccus sp. TaxID=2706531 RepID=UPI002D7FCD67|nr:DsbA family protein [Segeticoccus sp.]HET8601113.1 DsbA family protein [Segeticoccus sp.]